MLSNSVKIFLLFFALLGYSSHGFSQTKVSGGLGLLTHNVFNENIQESIYGSSDVQLRDTKGFLKPTVSLQLRLDKRVGSRFYAAYNFKFYVKKFDADFCECGSYTPTGFVGNTQGMSSVHAGTMRFEPFQNFQFGFGVFYHMTQISGFRLIDDLIPFSRPAHQTGLITVLGFSKAKWSFELQYMKSISGVMYRVKAFEAIDMLELSAFYQFHQLKTKKERRALKKARLRKAG